MCLTFPQRIRTEGREVILEDVSVEADGGYEVMEAVEKVPGGVSINSADVLVAGGRGIKSEADIAMLRELASLIGGELACSRPLVDEGWLAHDCRSARAAPP